MISNKKIMIFGGSGSLGNELIKTYLSKNQIIIYSRDENKHWQMSLKYNNPNLNFIIGDIRDSVRVENSIMEIKPNIIIIAAALKHIDRCEYAVHECFYTNFIGTQNIINTVNKYRDTLIGLETIVFISTDKACNPINTYGICKALSEKTMIEASLTNKNFKFVSVRYGNVLNSRGSIIPILHEIGKDTSKEFFSLTHPDMTRFIMTLENSVELIEHAILYAESGDIVIPTLKSMKIIDLLEIFCSIYNKPIKITGLRPGEKLLETLINESQSISMEIGEDFYYIKPYYKNVCKLEQLNEYNSKINPISKDQLIVFLKELNLI